VAERDRFKQPDIDIDLRFGSS